MRLISRKNERGAALLIAMVVIALLAATTFASIEINKQLVVDTELNRERAVKVVNTVETLRDAFNMYRELNGASPQNMNDLYAENLVPEAVRPTIQNMDIRIAGDNFEIRGVPSRVQRIAAGLVRGMISTDNRGVVVFSGAALREQVKALPPVPPFPRTLPFNLTSQVFAQVYGGFYYPAPPRDQKSGVTIYPILQVLRTDASMAEDDLRRTLTLRKVQEVGLLELIEASLVTGSTDSGSGGTLTDADGPTTTLTDVDGPTTPLDQTAIVVSPGTSTSAMVLDRLYMVRFDPVQSSSILEEAGITHGVEEIQEKNTKINHWLQAHRTFTPHVRLEATLRITQGTQITLQQIPIDLGPNDQKSVSLKPVTLASPTELVLQVKKLIYVLVDGKDVQVQSQHVHVSGSMSLMTTGL